jgi:hypothetical protein
VDVWEYFETREREIKECSLHIPEHVSLFSAEEGDQRGMVYGPVLFNGYPANTCLFIHEKVEVKGSGITRPRYAYFLIINGREVGGYERHASHDPPVHRHCSGRKHHERTPAKAISFKRAAAEAWRYVSELAVPISRTNDPDGDR